MTEDKTAAPLLAVSDTIEALQDALASGEDPKECAEAVAASWDQALEQLEVLGELLDLGQITAELVHEFRQPLVGLKAFGQMIEASPDSKSVASHAAKIVEQADRMSRLVDRFEKYLRSGMTPPDPQRIDINTVISDTAKLLRRRFENGLELELKLSESPVWAYCEPFVVQQIVANLLSNAVDAIGKAGGQVVVSTSVQDEFAAVEVTDTGPGIEASIQDKLFERFATSKSSGLGLGLNLSRKHAREAGGDLVLVDTDAGTRFRLTVPLNEES